MDSKVISRSDSPQQNTFLVLAAHYGLV